MMRMKCTALTLIVLGLLASPQPVAAFELNSFSGNPVEARDWSQLCVEKDGDYLMRNGDSDNPFAGCARTSEAANSCQRQCAQETSDCVAIAGRAGNRPNVCLNYTAACLSRCRGE
jgi:hypothetical protein